MVAERIRRRVLVTGRVQGVAFRAATRAEARAAGVDGWVRNLRDGRVEAVFEGERRAVEALVAFSRRGPAAARVTDVQVFEEPVGDDQGFHVQR